MVSQSEGVDYSFARPSPAGLAAAGKTFAGRYVGPGSGKLLTAGERDELLAAGLDIMLLAEGTADGALGGYNMGVYHGELAKAAAQALGAPWDTAIYFAVDFDVTADQWPIVAQYLHGAGFAVGAPQVGVYGGLRAVQWAARDGVADWFFQTYAWSEGQWFPGNHVEQYHNGVQLAGGEVDLCRSVQAEFGQWRANPAPEMRSSTMYVINAPGDFTLWLSDGFKRKPIYTIEQASSYLAGGAAVRLSDVPLEWYGDPIAAGGDPVQFTAEELAQISDAARRGAQEGISGATVTGTIHAG